MIDQWLITGDTHGVFSRFEKLQAVAAANNETYGVIILGDAGINFWLNKSDKRLKNKIAADFPNLWFYCVRGNHEERPEYIQGMYMGYDTHVQGSIYFELEFPQIRYFVDGGEYVIGDYKVLTIGGAYSIDKEYRLQRAKMTGVYAGWFEGEQLSDVERQTIAERVEGQAYDIVLTHTCPISWEPRDLFLPFVDQSRVDKTMELWLEDLKGGFEWKVWAFGHFHDDRTIEPGVLMLSQTIRELENIVL